jgi:hypothetical protein
VEFTPAGLRHSVISMHEKREHVREVQATAARHAGLRDQIEARASTYAAYDRLIRPAQDSLTSTA